MREKPPLEAVLFDAGGTLVRLDFEWMTEALQGLGVPCTVEAFRRAEIAGRRRYDATRAVERRGDEERPLRETFAYFAAMVETLGGDGDTVDRALEAFRDHHLETGLWTRPMEGARGAIDALLTTGLVLAVVSNSDGRAERHLRDCEVRDGLAFVVDSHVVGFEKPDPRIFSVALDRLGVAPERALFVGDILSVDRDGAARAGTPFVLLDPYGDYAPAGVPAIASIAALPEWIRLHFEPAARTADRAPGRAGAGEVS